MPAKTLAQLQTQVGEIISDPSFQEWTAAQLTIRLNEAQEQFILDTQAFSRTLTNSVVAGTRAYSIGVAGVIRPIRVTHNGIDLRKTSEAELDLMYDYDWTTIEGTPTLWYITNDASGQYLNVFPKPAAADAGSNNLITTLVQVPDSMSASNDVPFTYSGTNNPLFDPYHKALSAHAAEAILVIRPTQEKLIVAQNCRAKYEQAVSQCIDQLRNLSQKIQMRGGRYF